MPDLKALNRIVTLARTLERGYAEAAARFASYKSDVVSRVQSDADHQEREHRFRSMAADRKAKRTDRAYARARLASLPKERADDRPMTLVEGYVESAEKSCLNFTQRQCELAILAAQHIPSAAERCPLIRVASMSTDSRYYLVDGFDWNEYGRQCHVLVVAAWNAGSTVQAATDPPPHRADERQEEASPITFTCTEVEKQSGGLSMKTLRRYAPPDLCLAKQGGRGKRYSGHEVLKWFVHALQGVSSDLDKGRLRAGIAELRQMGIR